MGLDAAWATRGLVGELRGTREHLERATDDLLAGRLEGAEQAFAAAGESAARAVSLAGHPAIRLADVLPFLGDDVDAVQALAFASERIAAGGPALVEAARAAGWEGSALTELMEDGKVDVGSVRAAAEPLLEAAGAFEEANDAIESVPTDGLFGAVAGPVLDAKREITRGARLVETAADLSRLLPGFLGDGSPRRYFLALQNLSAPRGSGGFLGMYGVLVADEGRLRLEEFGGTGSLGSTRAVAAPRAVRERYARFGGVTHFIAANYSPDFPSTAKTLLAMWEASGRRPLDGVIGTDPLFMADMLNLIGPVETAAWPEPLTAENASDVLHRDTFLLASSTASNQAQEEIGLAVWQATLERLRAVRGLADALSQGVRERHLQIYSRNGDEELLLGRLGAAGEIALERNPLFVVLQDAVGSRAGYYASTAINHRVAIAPDGGADVRTEVTLENAAPAGPPSLLLGFGDSGDPVGHYAAFTNVYLPEAATGIRTTVDGRPGLGLLESEFGLTVVLDILQAPAQKESTMVVDYHVPGAVTLREGVSEYRLQILPQPALRPGRVVIELDLPDGADVLAMAPGFRAEGSTIRFQGAPTVLQSLWIRFRG
jgi:hypothetical protein